MQNTKKHKKSSSWSFSSLIWSGLLWFTRILAVQASTTNVRGITISDNIQGKTLITYRPLNGDDTLTQGNYMVQNEENGYQVPLPYIPSVECEVYADKEYLPKECENQTYVDVVTTLTEPPEQIQCCKKTEPIKSSAGANATKRFQLGDTNCDPTKTGSLGVELWLSPSVKPCKLYSGVAYVPIVKIGTCRLVDTKENTAENTICYKP